MAKRKTGLGPTPRKKSSSKKTKKRLAIKREMLAEKAKRHKRVSK